jgi:NADH-quinone oxidoreductase subunit G
MAEQAQMVRLSIDGRDVEVPAGTGLVEAAQSANIEIPVFCYEPRVGPAVGACRMCLVDIEGMPKLQTACSTSVRDGMVVSTVGDRPRAGQDAVLEFLLVNHPLDCPVCDKGGECPLQDHAFRYGPGASRFLETKRTNDKPVPISPLIALDRERCILCYRCTRFSSDVAQDNQLITKHRGANSIIATFDDRPYVGHFSGNITELCPVGALTSTEYRFQARPWESSEHPSVCGLCPVGCNVDATMREGRVQRVLSRENAELDNGWLCDRGRFSYTSLYHSDRVTTPQLLGKDASVEVALEWLHDQLQARAATWVLSGNETLEEAYAIQRIAAATGGSVVAVEGGSAEAPKHSLTLAQLGSAERILILGDADVAEVAPIVELRVREAINAGAAVSVFGAGGTALELAGAELVATDPADIDGGLREWAKELPPDVREQRTALILLDGQLTGDTTAFVARALKLDASGSGIVSIPAGSNARGLAALGIEPVGIEALKQSAALVLVGVDVARNWPGAAGRNLLGGADWVCAIDMFPQRWHELANLVLPAQSWLEKEGTLVNLEGRLQRLTPAGTSPESLGRGELSWLSGLARRLGEQVPAHTSGVFKLLAAGDAGQYLPAKTYADIGPQGVRGVTGTVAARPLQSGPTDAQGREVNLFLAPSIYDADDVRHAPAMEFLLPKAVVTMSAADRERLELERGQDVRLRIGADTITATVAFSRRIPSGNARMQTGAPGVARDLSGWHVAGLDIPLASRALSDEPLSIDSELGLDAE